MCNFSRAKYNSLFDLPIKKRGKKQFIVRFFWRSIKFIRFFVLFIGNPICTFMTQKECKTEKKVMPGTIII